MRVRWRQPFRVASRVRKLRLELTSSACRSWIGGSRLWRITVGGVLLLSVGCAARSFAPPAGPGTPSPEAVEAFEAATSGCRDARTLTAEAGLSGRLGRQRIRGRLHLGLTASGALRLEAIAPFGAPVFLLAGDDDRATLIFFRENRVLAGAPPAEIIEALAGIALTPKDLFLIATGCFGADASAPAGPPVGARFDGGLLQVTRNDSTVVWLTSDEGRPRLRAARRGDLLIEYLAGANNQPSAFRVSRRGPAGDAILQLTLSQVERNVPLDRAVFEVETPSAAQPMSLEELRRASPLGRAAS
jgi:hypothetical protein